MGLALAQPAAVRLVAAPGHAHQFAADAQSCGDEGEQAKAGHVHRRAGPGDDQGHQSDGQDAGEDA